MIIGIERMTDHRCPESKIRKFTSESAARRWESEADPNPPYSDSNHHRVRDLYEMPRGYRLDMKKVRALEEATRHSMYRRYGDDAKALIYMQDGKHL